MVGGKPIYTARQPEYKQYDMRYKAGKQMKAAYEKRRAYYDKRKKAGLSVG